MMLTYSTDMSMIDFKLKALKTSCEYVAQKLITNIGPFSSSGPGKNFHELDTE